jgi:hypothetical protein
MTAAPGGRVVRVKEDAVKADVGRMLLKPLARESVCFSPREVRA